MIVKDVDSFMTGGAVSAQTPKSEKHLCQYHAMVGMVGFSVNHIVPISKPKEAIFYFSVSDRL